eukprot:TRINITY_DN76438_c0_g1_i1.p2 TRINITY_DN76438_c0_g1~~TRINITY_DN76438_c0_g1_i1.p2  ORF type:complete len:179 (-),score=82.79 TRINITY_DN76438_c0_g1_i1:74-610(-)
MFACCAAPSDTADVVQVPADDSAAKEAEVKVAAQAAEAKQAEETAAALKKADEDAAAKKVADDAAADEAAKKKATEEAKAAEAAKAAPVQYTVELRMDDACTPIGIELRQPSCKVKSMRDGCLAAKYNADGANATKIAVGDTLVAFNDATSDLVKAIQAAYQKKEVGMKMTLKFEKAA